MEGLLNSFFRDLDQIESYINHIDHINQVIKYKLNPHDTEQIRELISKVQEHNQDFKTKKIFEYKAIVISLYGYLEKFVEDLIVEYLSALNSIVDNYSDLPNQIKNTHFDLSAKLLQNLGLAKYANRTTKEEIIRKLHSCIEN
ncbi:MAG: hypothetical protein HC880_12580 [Bacteroidia bacterium]|nr:hypothetical protein [Bacteroidia bacterium]